MGHHEILIVEDEASIRFGMRRFLEGRGFGVTEAQDCKAARSAWRRKRPDLALVDYQLPDGDALELLPSLRATGPDVPVIILTGYGSVDLAVRAMKGGATDFLTKPVEMESLVGAVRSSLSAAPTSPRNGCSRPCASPCASDGLDPFLGDSAVIRALAVDARQVARSDCPVLLLGETGSGKGVLARWIHGESPRRSGTMMELNCAGLARELLESELFGHGQGAFTGATRPKQGLLEAADGGSVFLDEIGDLDPSVQPKLLKVVEEHSFRRLGEVRARNVDLRLIAATHHRLAEQVAEGSFRADLYYRLSTFCLTVPPLRQRPEDIPALTDALLEELSSGAGEPPSVDPGALATLRRHDWPGNIRELKNVLQRALVFSEGGTLESSHLRFDTPARSSPASPLACGSLQQAERQLIEAALRRQGGNVTAAARQLGVGRSTLYEKIKRYELR
jgi:DNA-binding NtrC family response regulator